MEDRVEDGYASGETEEDFWSRVHRGSDSWWCFPALGATHCTDE